jgi:hypothetical protein
VRETASLCTRTCFHSCWQSLRIVNNTTDRGRVEMNKEFAGAVDLSSIHGFFLDATSYYRLAQCRRRTTGAIE